jgi:disulfide bond formation protein DsbB
MRAPSLSPDLERVLNFLGMTAMLAILLGAYAYQFSYRELPCTLCLLQRLAMAAVAYGAAMNLVLGPSARHYGVCLVSALFGLAVSLRQSLLHINPYFDKKTGQPSLDPTANPAFGESVMGLNLYVWGVVIFATVILAVGVVQLLGRQGRAPAADDGDARDAREPDWLRRLAGLGVALLFLVLASEAVLVFLECGFGDCPNDGGWDWRMLG